MTGIAAWRKLAGLMARVAGRGPDERSVRGPAARLIFRDGALRHLTGEPVTLRGMSLFWSQWAPAFYNQEVVRWLARDWKVDVIRIPVAAAAPGYLDNPKGEVAKAIEVIDAAIGCGLYALVDWHGHHPHTDRAIELFDCIAGRYGDDPHLLYESWNEPDADYDWKSVVRSHHQAVIATIRRHAPGAPVILGSPGYCASLEETIEHPVAADNVGYAFHFYAASHREGLRQRLNHALDRRQPVFVSEWGLSEAEGDGVLDPAEGERWLDLLNARCVSHIAWSICDKDEGSAALVQGASPSGHWRRRDLSPSGRWLRSYLRRATSQPNDAPGRSGEPPAG